MPAEAPSHTALVRRARRINRELAAVPGRALELDFTTPLELLVATILSAQCTDERVNLVTPALFARYPTAADYAAADRAELEKLIQSTGFFRNKANSLIGLGQALVRPVRRRGARHARRTWSPCPASAARRRTSSSATRSACRASRSTRTSAGSPAGCGWTDAGRPGQGRAGGRRAGPAQGVDHAVAPGDLPRPAGLPRPQARRAAPAPVGRLCPSFGVGPTDEATARKLVKAGPFS